jgi:multidrug efflux pump subunit AcrB
MNLVAFALRRPITILVLVIAAVLTGGLAINRMPRDIFPDLGVPVLYVAQPYGGMDPAQMEGFLVNYYEYHFLYITGIEHVESKSIQGAALIKLQFHPGTNMAGAMAETVGYVNRARAFMPAGTVPPFVMRFDAGSVPVGDLVFTDTTGKLSLKDMQDAALFRVRPLFATLPGVSAPPPFGGAPRTIVINADPDQLRSYNMSPDEVVAALTKGNAISPSGNVRFGNMIPMVPVNSVVSDLRSLGDVPIRSDGTRTVFIRDIGKVEDASDIETGYAIVNGHRTVYISVTKRSDASTLSVVNLVKANLPKFQSVLPEGVKVSYEFDQSPYVVRAIWGLTLESALGAILTGLMVLLFLRDWRSALVVVVNIPLAILGAVVALWASGQTVNLMTLGGLALAVGILVDEGTVVIENVHSHIAHGRSLRQATYDGTRETRAPNLLSMLCILAVFISAFFMQGAAHNLFIPMALAVGFAMIASYVLSSTLVPVLLIWILPRGHATEVARRSGFDRFRDGYRLFARRAVALRWTIVGAYLLIAAGVILLIGGNLGNEIFPQVDAGQFALRLRGPAGTRIEETEKLANKTLDIIARQVGRENVALTLGFVGVQNAAYPINTIYLWTSGPEEAMLQVQLNRNAGIAVAALKERLRKRLSDELPDVRFSFEPNDIVSQVMSFGAPTPIEVAVTSPDFAKSRQFAQRIQEALGEVTPLRDLAFQQELDYPAVKITIDRQIAGMLGVTADQIGRSVTEATSSSRFTVPNFWPDPRSGIGYQVQVQVPPPRMNSIEEVKNIVIGRSQDTQVNLRNVADVTDGTVLGEYDRYNMQRMLTLGANISGEDLGRVAERVSQVIAKLGPPPQGVNVTLRGQVVQMQEMFSGLRLGLLVATIVIFLLLAANFQSFRLSVAIVLTIPAVLAGVAVALWITDTTLNIQSLMGAITAIGVAVANAILLVTFAENERLGGANAIDAAVWGASSRLRPIMMTSCAMIAGMLPMAIGLGEGGDQTAPLGRAVIGGLSGGTIATLIILPVIFAILQSNQRRGGISLHPGDSDAAPLAPDGPPVRQPQHRDLISGISR